MISKILKLLCLLLISNQGFSQKYIKPFVGINFSNRILTSDNAQRKDSLDQADKMKPFPMAGVQFLFEKTQGREFYFGVDYLENGFIRERLDYKFLDSVHDIGKIFDLSHAAQKNGYFTYHFKYLELPLGFNFQVTPRSNMNMYTAWFNIGLTPQVLIKQSMTIFLQGFSMKGENRFYYSNTGYNAAKINLAFQTGGRFDVNVKGKFWVTMDALMRMQLLHSATSANEKLRVWHLTANLGIRYEVGSF
ncbi:MAG: hypothetical protein ACKVQB_06025 [Bacteroidia bacterium]